jgi:hypothetical protein
MKMGELILNKEIRDCLAANASVFISNFTWDKTEKEYLSFVDHLVGPGID